MKPKRTPRPDTKARIRSRTRSTPHRSTGKRKRKSKARRCPNCVKYLLAGLIVITFGWTFYYFFIQPYAYRWRSCHGRRAYNTCMPKPYTVHGIDISHHQGDIVWNTLEVARNGMYPLHFIFMKATEGSNWCDKAFEKSFARAAEHGFIRGAYHYYKTGADAEKQADHFIRHVKLQKGDLPPVLDIEEVGKLSTEALQSGVKTWLKRVEAHYGAKPILYTSYKFKLKYLNDPFFDDYPFWIAHYYVNAVHYTGKWAFWQHTDQGRVPGISEKVDMNIFNGKLEELNELVLGACNDK